MGSSRMRRDIQKLKPEERDTLIRAFQYIMSLEPGDPDSYFTIAGYHGIPAVHCQHGNILFHTWHRAYLLRLENALRKAPGCENLALPYWNETSQDTAEHGLPAIFTDKSYRFVDGKTIPNPLFSYKMQKLVKDGGKVTSAKPEGYQTVRYPYSGLVTDQYQKKTTVHNADVDKKPPEEITAILNQNIRKWLTAATFKNHKGESISAGAADDFVKCLDAPNYTVFSNQTSAQAWNKDNHGRSTKPTVVPLESPHNAIHLAVGGFDVPGDDNYDAYPFANGDMGENDTAAFDPVFYFHHCFIDYMFWRWQDKHNRTTKLDIIAGYPGTEGVSLDKDLMPFKMVAPNTGLQRFMKSTDVVNIADLGYTYPAPLSAIVPAPEYIDAPKLCVSGINRGEISGSFLVTTWAKGKNGAPDRLLHIKPVLSRWNVSQCDNCQQHLDVEAHVHLKDYSDHDAKDADFFAKVHTRENFEGEDRCGGRPIQIELTALGDAE